jgi:hypothetical protein
MKRMIVCKKCRTKLTPVYAGEWFKRIRGEALHSMRCDWCFAEIPKNAECAAESMGLDNQPYFEWEHEYIIF